MYFNSVGEHLALAIARHEQKINRVYRVDYSGLSVLDLILRSGVVDIGGYTDLCTNPSLTNFIPTHGGCYKFLSLKDQWPHSMTTQEMYVCNELYPVGNYATLAELLELIIDHRKVVMDLLWRGHSISAIGHDLFRVSFGTYAEISLGDHGVIELARKKMIPGEWRRRHILLIRDSFTP